MSEPSQRPEANIPTELLAAMAGAALRKHDMSFCAAESCTGGLLLSTMTDIAGSSAYVLGGVVTYSNATKQKLAGVREETLIAHGAVSEPTAREMAVGVRRLFDADVAVSITGIAGPGGGTAEKPVGLVYIGLAWGDGEVQVQRHVWDGDRLANKIHSIRQAMHMIRSALAADEDQG